MLTNLKDVRLKLIVRTVSKNLLRTHSLQRCGTDITLDTLAHAACMTHSSLTVRPNTCFYPDYPHYLAVVLYNLLGSCLLSLVPCHRVGDAVRHTHYRSVAQPCLGFVNAEGSRHSTIFDLLSG